MTHRAAAIIVAAAGAGVAAWWYVTRLQQMQNGVIAADNFGFLDDGSGIFAPAAGAAEGVGELLTSAADTVLDYVDGALHVVGLGLGGRWLTQVQRPDNAAIYQALLAAELAHSIPSHMLVRLAYQESRYNAKAYNARSGATGIMQIVPKWHPGVDATDPFASIDYAGRFLSDLYRQFGNWESALQSYNWGAANLKKHLSTGKPSMPTETANYSRMILADVGQSVGYA